MGKTIENRYVCTGCASSCLTDVMDVSYRTVLRVFLVVGGTGLLLLGVLDADVVNIGIGAVALFLGAIGLAAEWREASK